MDALSLTLGALVGLALGVGLGAFARGRDSGASESAVGDWQALQHELRAESGARATAEAMLARERELMVEERQFLADAQKQLHDAFSALSAKALESNNERFMTLARATLEKYQEGAKGDMEKREQAIEHLVKPLRESLSNVDVQFRRIEKERAAVHEHLVTQIRTLETTAGTLATALRAPKARGQWGELQLRRVVELAGMVQHCDFTEQTGSRDSEGSLLTPDLVVKLPGGKSIVVDAKTPLDSYLSAVEATNEDERAMRLREHAARVKMHVKQLSAKAYWKQFESSPAFVVMFLPGEHLYSAALEVDPGLIEMAATENVIIATPTTLIATLRAVAQGWREEALAENARVISELGRELYERAAKISEQWCKLGRSLDTSVRTYNEAVGSMETRFLVTARKLADVDVPITKEIADLQPVETVSRRFRSEDLSPAPSRAATELAVSATATAGGLQLAVGADG